MAPAALLDDLRSAWRSLRRAPRTAFTAILTLAFGIAAASAMLTTAHTFLLAPPPFRDAARLVEIRGPRTPQGWTQGVSGEDFLDYLHEPGLFEAGTLTGYAEFSWTGQSLAGFDGAEVLRGLSVTNDYFQVFDHPMALGRGFRPGEAHAAVLSYAVWMRRFGGQPAILGQSVTLNGTPHLVVGIAGRGFPTYASYEVSAWVPFAPATQWRSSRQYHCTMRLSHGVTLDQAQRRLASLNQRLAAAYPATNTAYSAHLEPFLQEARAEARPAVLALTGAALCLLLIAAANVAGLLLARATGRSREMAIRTALGATALRLYRMTLGESLLLAAAASVAGAALGVALVRALQTLVPPSLAMDWVFVLDARIFAAALALCVVTGVLAGTGPAIEAVRLGSGDWRGPARGRLLRTITTVEIALAVVLSIGAGLLGKSVRQLLDRPLGYRTEALLGLRIRLTGERYNEVDRRTAYWNDLLQRAASLPGIAMAATVSDLPMGQQYRGGRFDAADRPIPSGGTPFRAHQMAASPGYFATLGIPLLAGRGFLDSDSAAAEPVAIVNDCLARAVWPGEDPIGKRIQAWDRKGWRRVVGVAQGVRHNGPADVVENQLYIPYRQGNANVMFLVVRTVGPPAAMTSALRATLGDIDPGIPAFEVRTLQAALDRATSLPRIPAALTAGFATLAAVLAAVGLFSVIAYWVSRRTREMGIRAAIGARPSELRALVLRQGLRMAGWGTAAGVTVALAVARYLRSLLYGLNEYDPWVFTATATLALATACAACWLPAARAGRVDPAEALREEG